MRNRKKEIIGILLTVTFLVSLLAGCGKSSPDMESVQTDIGTITVPEEVQVVGLGEASHGVKEYQEMKEEVFKALVQNNGCRTFVIEGDFGSALKVDAYIHGGEGTPKEAAAWTGFQIYCTKEMEHLLEWMRSYNETALQGEDLHFYGMDMQWADSGKGYLFRILEQVAPQVSTEYEEKLIQEVDGAQELIEEALSLSTGITGILEKSMPRPCTTVLASCWRRIWAENILQLGQMRMSRDLIPRQRTALKN